MYIAYKDSEAVDITEEQHDAFCSLIENIDGKIVEAQVTPELLTSEMGVGVFSHLDEEVQYDVLLDFLLRYVPLNDMAREHVCMELKSIARNGPENVPDDISPIDNDDYQYELYDWFTCHVDSEMFDDTLIQDVEGTLTEELRKFIQSHWSTVKSNIGNPARADTSDVENELARLEDQL